MDLDRVGHELIQVHKHFFSFNVRYFWIFFRLWQMNKTANPTITLNNSRIVHCENSGTPIVVIVKANHFYSKKTSSKQKRGEKRILFYS